MKILIVASHPDDYELSMSGTAMKHIKEKEEVYVIIATNGGRGGDPKQRKEDSQKFSKKTKIKKIFFLDMPDTKLSNESFLVEKTEEIIKKTKPDIIYTHYPEDTHQDHRALSKAVQAAGRNIKNILFFESASTQKFIPNYFVDITSLIDRKLKLLKSFTTKTDAWYWEIDAIKGKARDRGYQAKVKFAEAFNILRIVR